MKGTNLYRASPSPPSPTTTTTTTTTDIDTPRNCKKTAATATSTTVTAATATSATVTAATAAATGPTSYECHYEEDVFEVTVGTVTVPPQPPQHLTPAKTEVVSPVVTRKPIPAYTPALHTWGLHIYHGALSNKDLAVFLVHLKEAGRRGGVEVEGPMQLRFLSTHDPMQEMRQLALTYPGLQMVIAVVKDTMICGRVKVVGELCLGVVVVCVLPSAVLQPSTTTLSPLVQHIKAKLGGPHLRLPRIAIPHVAPSLLVMALHRATARARVPEVVAVVALSYLPACQYITEVYAQDDDDETRLEDVVCRILQALTRQHSKPFPEQVIVYSDGDGERAKKDMATVTSACVQSMGSYRPQVTCVCVCGSILSWFVVGDVEGPATPRCLPEQRATQLSETSFSVSVSSDRQSWQPAVYSIVGSGMALPALQQLTLALCHLPGTPTALQPLPAPLTCARLAVLRCKEHMRTLHNIWRQREYRCLQRDIKNLVSVDVSKNIAHQLYYI